MQFWIETSKGERIMLMPLDEDGATAHSHYHPAGFTERFYADLFRWQPLLRAFLFATASSTASFTIMKNDEDSIELRYGDEVLLRTDEYDTIKLTHRIAAGQRAGGLV